MEPFLEWDLKVLPFVIGWFDRARGYAQNDEGNIIGAKNLDAIYQFARTVPLMFVPYNSKAGDKRKFGENK